MEPAWGEARKQEINHFCTRRRRRASWTKVTAPEQCWGTRGTRPQTPASFPRDLLGWRQRRPQTPPGCPAHAEPPASPEPPASRSSSSHGGFPVDSGREAETPAQGRCRGHHPACEPWTALTRAVGAAGASPHTGHTGFVSTMLLSPRDTACHMSAPGRIFGQALLRLGLQH